jgi:hypothetical protein
MQANLEWVSMDKFENNYQIYSIKIISIFIFLPINNSSPQIRSPLPPKLRNASVCGPGYWQHSILYNEPYTTGKSQLARRDKNMSNCGDSQKLTDFSHLQGIAWNI